jgi:hypothetical protein
MCRLCHSAAEEQWNCFWKEQDDVCFLGCRLGEGLFKPTNR